ncbi:unnamed protein product, partial [Tenebrio molitor]
VDPSLTAPSFAILQLHWRLPGHMCDLFGVRKYLEWSLIFDLGSMQMTFDPCKYFLRVRFYWRTRRCQHCFSIGLRSGAPDGRFIAVRADNWTV